MQKTKRNPSPPAAKPLQTGRLLVGAAGTLGFALLVLPLIALAARGVLNGAWMNLPESTVVWDAVWLSLRTTAITLVLTVLFGTPLAYILARWHFPGKHIANLFIELPIVMPPAVAGLALLVAFGRRGVFGELLLTFGISLPFSTEAVILAQLFVSAPFYIRAAQLGFAGISREIEAAARVDGAEGFTLFRYVTLPLALRALASGLILSWARALGEFGATVLFAGNFQGVTQTMPLLVYGVFERDIDAAIWTGLVLIAMALVALVGSQWLARRGEVDEP